jgi:PIN domain nuclease of toxin-antitoxin system
LALLIDTHALIWLGEGNPRLPTRVLDRIIDPDEEIVVSAVTAYEYADLRHRGRIPERAHLSDLQERLMFKLLDYPAELWTLAATLPPLHCDPVDRMLIAHAMALDVPLVTADATIRRYPITTMWD